MEKRKEMSGMYTSDKKRTEEETKLMINRLNRIEGQVRGIRRMVEKKCVLSGYSYTSFGDYRGIEQF